MSTDKTPYPIRERDLDHALRKAAAQTALRQYTQGLFARSPRLTLVEINMKISEAKQLYKEACTEIETTVESHRGKVYEPADLDEGSSNKNYSPRLAKG